EQLEEGDHVVDEAAPREEGEEARGEAEPSLQAAPDELADGVVGEEGRETIGGVEDGQRAPRGRRVDDDEIEGAVEQIVEALHRDVGVGTGQRAAESLVDGV